MAAPDGRVAAACIARRAPALPERPHGTILLYGTICVFFCNKRCSLFEIKSLDISFFCTISGCSRRWEVLLANYYKLKYEMFAFLLNSPSRNTLFFKFICKFLWLLFSVGSRFYFAVSILRAGEGMAGRDEVIF